MTTQHSFYEILAKETAYVFDSPKFERPVDEFIHSKGYFNKLNTELRAFGLLPIVTKKSPILVFCSIF